MNTETLQAAMAEARAAVKAASEAKARAETQKRAEEAAERETWPAKAKTEAEGLIPEIPECIKAAITYHMPRACLYSVDEEWGPYNEKKPASGKDQFDGPCVGDEGEFQILF